MNAAGRGGCGWADLEQCSYRSSEVPEGCCREVVNLTVSA